MSEPRPNDNNQELVENYFANKGEWEYQRLFQCEAGHLRLVAARSPISDQAGEGTCSVSERGGPQCCKTFAPYSPDDEGLTPLQWAHRLLCRKSEQMLQASMRQLRLERRIKELETYVAMRGVRPGGE
jgi:hypothetical protein